MFSIPPLNTILRSPKRIYYAPTMSDFIPLAHTLLINVLGVSTLHPAPRVACLSGAYPVPAMST